MTKIKNALNWVVSNKEKIVTTFFVVFMVCFLMYSTAIVQKYNIAVKIVALIRYFSYVVLAGCIGIDVLLKKKISLVMVIAGLLSLIIMLFTKEFAVVSVVIVLSAVGGIDVKKLVKPVLCVVGILFFLNVILSLVGVFPDFVYLRGDVVRHSLGLTYPTDVFAVFLSLVLMFVYLRGTKIKYIELGVMLALTCAFYYLTDGRLSFLLCLLTIVFALAYKLTDRFLGFQKLTDTVMTNKIFKWTVISVPLVLFAFAVALVLLYRCGSNLGEVLNNVLSGRLIYSSEAFTNYPLTAFGTEVEWIGWGGMGYLRPYDEAVLYNFVDISYIRILFDYGIIGSVAILFGYSLAIKDAVKEKNLFLLTVILVMLCWCFVEPFILNLGKNIFVVCLAKYMGKCEITVKPLTYLGNKFEKLLA